MAQPPTPEQSALGLGTPSRGRIGRFFDRNRPMISVDPETLNMIGRVKDAVRGLTGEMQKLALEAERYARAMGHATGRPFAAGGGRRATNFPEIMRPSQGGGGGGLVPSGQGGWTIPPAGGGGGGGGGGRGGRSYTGGLTFGEELVVGGYARDIVQAIIGQIGAVAQRESTMSRVGMAMPGQYQRGGLGMFGPRTGRDVQQMMRTEAYGYTSSGELYSGAQRLQDLGLLRGMGQRDRRLVQEASLAGRITGQGFGGGVEAMAGFRQAPFVNAMQQFNIAAPFTGGNMNMFGQQGMLEQLYQLMTRGMKGENIETFLTGPQAKEWMESMGISPEQQRLVTQYGAARAEGVGAGDTKELQRRFKDTGESLKDLREAFTELMDVLSTGLVPIIQGMSTVLKPLADWFAKLNDTIPGLEEAVGTVVTALLAYAAMVKAQSFLTGLGGLGGRGGGQMPLPGMGGGKGLGSGMTRAGAKLGARGGILGKAGGMLGAAGGLLGKAAPLAGKLGRGLGFGLLGSLGGDIVQNLFGGDEGGAMNVLGGAAGGAARGAGIGAAIGSLGFSLGPLGVATAPLGAGIGAIAGGLYGGISNLIGDAWEDAVAAGGGGDAAPKDPTKPAASGTELRGARGGDANMNPEFVKRLAQMFADNPKLSLTSGWRDSAAQARLYREKPHLAAPPGKSNHERGTAADIGPPSEYPWIAANVGKYGLFLPMPSTAERKAKGKKIEPWHVEPVGLTGAVPPQAAAGADAYAAATSSGASAGGEAGAKAKSKSPEVGPSMGGAGSPAGGTAAYQVASVITGRTGGTQIGDAWEGYGDNEVATYGGTPVSRRGGSITIGRIEINLTIARGTPEEADKFARYLGGLLGDRDRMLSLARNGGKN